MTGHYFYITPPYLVKPDPKRLHHGFFGGEAASQRRGAATAELYFGMRVYAAQELFTPTGDSSFYALYLHEVNTNPVCRLFHSGGEKYTKALEAEQGSYEKAQLSNGNMHRVERSLSIHLALV